MFTLIPLEIKNAAELEIIHKYCFPDGWNQKAFEQLLKEKWTCGWLAKSEENKSIGFLLVRIIDHVAEILTFAILPDFQGKGCGRFLLNELKQFLKSIQCGKVFLEVAIDNTNAIILYKSMGFVIRGLRPNYYKIGPQNYTSAYIMSYEE